MGVISEIEICGAQDGQRLAAEIAELSSGSRVMSAAFDLYLVEAWQIPLVLREIGRERERAFRAAGEGTGQAFDLDEFDEHYLHLFLWDEENARVAGAYRLGLTDEILPRLGAGGLYTTSLFEFEPELLEYLTPGIELGRSFVTLEYQRQPMALYQLWQGIGRFVAERPRYGKLFGPVSISDTYQYLSKQLIVKFLDSNSGGNFWQKKVRGRCSYLRDEETCAPFAERLASLASLTTTISSLEPDGKGMPVLLRHYVKLNSVVLSFHVDEKFSNSLDVLILTDLQKAPDATLRRILGPRGAESLLSYRG